MTNPAHETPPPAGPAADLAAALRAMIPVVETDRLTLRAPEIADFPVVAEIATSPRAKGIGGPMTREGAWGEFVQLTATWLLRGHGFWSVVRKDTGETIGFTGIGFEPGDLEPELGYAFAESAEGLGYATEAAAAARDEGFGALGLASMVSYVERDNTRSVAVAHRLGAVEDTPPGWKRPTTLVFRHPRPEAPA